MSDGGSEVCSSDLEFEAVPADVDSDRVAFIDEAAGAIISDVDEDFGFLAEISDIAQFPFASRAASLKRLKRALRGNGCHGDAVCVAAADTDRAGVRETDGETFAGLCASTRDPPSGVTPRRACRDRRAAWRERVGKYG